MNKNILRDLLITVISSVVVVVACFYGSTVHLPFLVGIITAIGLGWLQPQKGWILAIEQTVLVVVFYFLFERFQLLTPINADTTRFTALLQFGPAFIGSFMGGYFKRMF
jgi:hypothetical protein